MTAKLEHPLMKVIDHLTDNQKNLLRLIHTAPAGRITRAEIRARFNIRTLWSLERRGLVDNLGHSFYGIHEDADGTVTRWVAAHPAA